MKAEDYQMNQSSPPSGCLEAFAELTLAGSVFKGNDGCVPVQQVFFMGSVTYNSRAMSCLFACFEGNLFRFWSFCGGGRRSTPGLDASE